MQTDFPLLNEILIRSVDTLETLVYENCLLPNFSCLKECKTLKELRFTYKRESFMLHDLKRFPNLEVYEGFDNELGHMIKDALPILTKLRSIKINMT